MDPSSVVYQDLSFQRALEELRKQPFSEHELLPIARAVLVSPSRTLRLEALHVLMQAEDVESCDRFRGLAEHDADSEVRAQAQQFLSKCPSS